MAADPITITEAFTLASIGIDPFTIDDVTMESDNYICVREKALKNNLVIIDMNMPMEQLRLTTTADSALMNPESRILALKVQLHGTTKDHLQIIDIKAKMKLKSHQMHEQVVFWKWINPKLLGLVTQTSVYHWTIDLGESQPVKMFDRTANLANNQIISYQCDRSEKWLALIGIAPGCPESLKHDTKRYHPQLVKGNMQLYSVEQQRSQDLEAHAASFAAFREAGNDKDSILISFASKTSNAGQITSNLHVIELVAQPGKSSFTKKQADMFFPPDFADDFPVAMQISHKYGLLYVITNFGLLFVYDLETATAVYRNIISPDPIFLTSEASSVGGFYAINRRGHVLLATVNEATIVPFVSGKLNNLKLAVNLAKRANLPGTEDLVVQRFEELLTQTKYKEAAELAAESPRGILRTPDTVAKFQSVPVQAGQTPPLLQYFGTLLTKGKLNAFESFELSRFVVNQNKRNLLESWLAEYKLECSEELGDLVKTVNKDLALQMYIKARAMPKVVAAFAERREFAKIFIYSKQVGYTPDYLLLLQTLLQLDPQGAVNFALMMSQMEGGCPVDYNTITDLFLQRNMIHEATTFLLDVLKPNLPEHANLQTKVLEINLVTFPNVADAILANGMFSHYDRPQIAQLCEKAGLYLRALQHYSELPDMKRVIVNTHSIEPQALVEFFGTVYTEWALECMKDLLLINLRGNLQIVVQVAEEYCEQLGVEACIELFEQLKSYEGLYFFLESYLSSSEDPDIHLKYIEAAAKTGQIKEVERVTRESNFYDPEKTKNFLMEAKLPDVRPLMNVCDRFGFVPDLTHYLYSSNMLSYIEDYVQKVNPGNAPLVVGQLLDDGCSEDFIKGLILSNSSLLPVEFLVEECEKRNRLCLLTQFLEHSMNEGSQDVHVYNALGKILIDNNNNPEHFLTTNPYYDSRVVGKYCEKHDPTLAVVAYWRGQCDDELINVTNKNSLFKLQARYVVERTDGDLWTKVLDPENQFRGLFIDQVVSTSLPESKSSEQVSAAVKALMTADLPHKLIELLEKIMLHNSAFSGNFNLQSPGSASPPSPNMGASGMKHDSHPSLPSPSPSPSPPLVIAGFHSWRGHWSLDPNIRQQGDCECCWVICSCTLASQAMVLKHSHANDPLLRTYEAAPQEIIDRLPKDEKYRLIRGDRGESKCERGNPFNALTYIRDHGIALEKDYKFVAAEQYLDGNLPPLRYPRIRIHEIKSLKNATFEEVKEVLRERAICAKIKYTEKLRSWIGTEVYPHPDDNSQEPEWHCIVVVGAGEHNGTRICEIRNSWGDRWGDNGFGKVPYAFIKPLYYVQGASLMYRGSVA